MYGDLSGWSTKGYQVCPICIGDKSSFGIKGKISFMGHRRFLPKNHIWWIMNGNYMLEQLDSLDFLVMSKHPSLKNKKRK